MAFDYSNLIETASDLIAQFGRDLTLYKVTETPSNTSKPWRGNATTLTKLALKGVFYSYQEKEVDNEQIKVGDQKVVVQTTSDIRNYSYLISENERWDIVNVMQTRPGSDTVVYTIQIRR